jgi:hypothetical protein
MKAICIAEAVQKTPFRTATKEDYEKAKREQKEVKKLVKKYEPKKVQNVHNIIARNQLEEKNYSETATVAKTADIKIVKPQLSKNQEIFKETANPFKRLRKEDVLSGVLLEGYI